MYSSSHLTRLIAILCSIQIHAALRSSSRSPGSGTSSEMSILSKVHHLAKVADIHTKSKSWWPEGPRHTRIAGAEGTVKVSKDLTKGQRSQSAQLALGVKTAEEIRASDHGRDKRSTGFANGNHMRGTDAKSGVRSKHSTLRSSHQNFLNQLAQSVKRWSKNMSMMDATLVAIAVLGMLAMLTILTRYMTTWTTGSIAYDNDHMVMRSLDTVDPHGR